MVDKPGPDVERPRLRATISLGVWIVVEAVVFFTAAGQWDLLRGWVFVGVRLLTVPVQIWVLSRMNPVLLRERFRRHQGTESFDKAILVLLLPMTLAIVFVAGLDVGRFHGSHLGMQALLPGIALLLLGFAVMAWVMATNPYLESTIRIQEDREHKVITAGPYRFVRHPMYVGAIIMYAGYPLILGSAWACLPYALLVLLYVLRTSMEDRMLRQRLPGYDVYCQRTRYRLLPGAW